MALLGGFVVLLITGNLLYGILALIVLSMFED